MLLPLSHSYPIMKFLCTLYRLKGSWPGCSNSMKSQADLNSTYSYDTVYKFSPLWGHVVLHYEGKVFVCMERTPKKLMMQQTYNSFFPLKHYKFPIRETCVWAKFIHTGVFLHYMGMCGSKEFFWIELKLSGLTTKTKPNGHMTTRWIGAGESNIVSESLDLGWEWRIEV